jgi:hypothetical protein
MANDRSTTTLPQRAGRPGHALSRYRVLVQSACLAASAAGIAALGMAAVL